MMMYKNKSPIFSIAQMFEFSDFGSNFKINFKVVIKVIALNSLNRLIDNTPV